MTDDSSNYELIDTPSRYFTGRQIYRGAYDAEHTVSIRPMFEVFEDHQEPCMGVCSNGLSTKFHSTSDREDQEWGVEWKPDLRF